MRFCQEVEMLNFFLTFALLSIPMLVHHIDARRKDLVIGLFLSLFFLGSAEPILCIVPFAAALFLFLNNLPRLAAVRSSLLVKNPAMPMFVVFLLSMTIFCALGVSFFNYGSFIGIDGEVIVLGEHWGNLALVLGPIWTGNRCDKKGPFSTAVLLTLLSELSVWIAVSGENHQFLFVVGSFAVHLCISGFFTLMPIISAVFFGDIRFYRRYPLIALSAAVTWTAVRTLYLNRWADTYNPGNFLISLLILTVISAIFVFVSWKRRFVVLPGDLNRKKLPDREADRG